MKRHTTFLVDSILRDIDTYSLKIQLKGKTLEQAEEIYQQVHKQMTNEDVDPAILGKLEVLGGVREFPARVKCATLSWHTMHTAMESDHDISVTTE